MQLGKDFSFGFFLKKSSREYKKIIPLYNVLQEPKVVANKQLQLAKDISFGFFLKEFSREHKTFIFHSDNNKKNSKPSSHDVGSATWILDLQPSLSLAIFSIRSSCPISSLKVLHQVFFGLPPSHLHFPHLTFNGHHSNLVMY